MVETLVKYPAEGTKAAQVLVYIQANPGTSRNGIINGLDLNPNVVKKAVQSLLEHGRIADNPDDRGYHRYSSK
jgi:DNA-binding IclR family transcriptional regulator